MTRFLGILFSLTASVFLYAAAVQAQNIPGFGGGSSSGSRLGDQLQGGTSGLLGQALPNVSSAGTSNTAGVLSYCVQNKYLDGNTANSALSALTGKSGVQSSSAFSAGQQGNLETGNGSMFSMSALKDQVKSKLCDMVLEHAQSLL